MKQLEEYYRIKTEEIHQRIAEDNKRQSLINTDNEEIDMNSILSSLIDLNEEYKELKAENTQLDIDFNETVDDLKRIQEEQMREHEKFDLEFNQFHQEFENKQDIVNEVIENNVSLQFELLTYRNLLNSEEKRLSRNQQEPKSPKSTDTMNGFSVQKLAMKKTTTGIEIFIFFLLIVISFSFLYS